MAVYPATHIAIHESKVYFLQQKALIEKEIFSDIQARYIILDTITWKEIGYINIMPDHYNYKWTIAINNECYNHEAKLALAPLPQILPKLNTAKYSKFKAKAYAFSNSYHTVEPSAVIVGDDGLYWVVTRSEMERLLKRGYELARE